MSVSFCLLLFIICLSLHFCDCRRFGSLEKKSTDRKFDGSTSKIENNYTRSDHQHAVDAMQSMPLPTSMEDQKSAAGEGNSGDSTSLKRITKTIKSSDAKNGKERYNKERKRSSTNPTGTSDASISWRVPHEEPSEKGTELFDSDYCPPKTHPPSHN